ncbi:vesicle-associated protein 1-1-like isoform X1 [Homarus americanus]|uniref:vesicle-associated protein 1-1-like isoform X1 n=1 Tax=Homarus americanus TaxID=6706 RepID=UPI001C477161|nr:vesicle-associated protein 1-1-like isoform X1 [Homarus americanus]
MFSSCRIGATAIIVLTNPTNTPIAYKIKTTSPEKYRVRPSVGILEAEMQLEIGVTLSEQLAPSALVRDKFLVMGAPASSNDLTSQGVSQLFKHLTTCCQIIALREEGLTVRAIADQLAVSTSTVKRWIRRYAEMGILTDLERRPRP